MKQHINKSDYSTKKTLENIKLSDSMSFRLSKNIQALAVDNSTFEKWDTITITKLELKDESQNKTHNVEYIVTNDNWKQISLNMSWWVFLKTFIEEIDPNLIVSKVKDKVEKIIK